MKDEEKLINSAKSGDEKAFGELYEKYLTPIYRYVFMRVGYRKHEAEDIAHQVFMSAWQNMRTYETQGFPFSSWLYRIAHNAVIDYYRTQRPSFDLELVNDNIAFADIPELENRIDDRMQMEGVRVALAKLEPDQQNVIIMKFVNELENKEIAQALGKTEGAVRVIQHRALKQLKTLLSAEGGSASGGQQNERDNNTIKEV